MEDIRQYLSSLGIHIQKQVGNTKSKHNTQSISLANSIALSNHSGSVFVIRELLPSPASSRFSQIPSELRKWLGIQQETEPLFINDFLFIDIETSGEYGGAGVLCFLIGIGQQTERGFFLSQYLLSHPENELAQLLEIESVLLSAKGIITYNGKSFDIPLLQSRFQYHKIPLPTRDLVHLDLLHLTRKIYRRHSPNRMLKTMEATILGIERATDDVPGWMIPSLYRDFLLTNDSSFLSPVLYHNKMDVHSLLHLYNHITHLIAEGIKQPNEDLDIYLNLADFYQSIGDFERAIEGYQHCLTKAKETAFEIQLLERLATIYKKQHRYDEAYRNWRQAAEKGSLRAHVELANHHSRIEKDPKSARYWLETATTLLDTISLDRFDRMKWQSELRSRLDRISKKETSARK